MRLVLPLAVMALALAVGGQVAQIWPKQSSPLEYADRTLQATVSVRATGGVSFSWSGEQKITLLRAGDWAKAAGPLTVSTFPHVLPERPTFRFSWQVALDSYTDKPQVSRIPPAAHPSHSMVTLLWMEVGDRSVDAATGLWSSEKVEVFSRSVDGCSLQLGPGARSGWLHCDGLRSGSGAVTDLTVSWSAAGSPLLKIEESS